MPAPKHLASGRRSGRDRLLIVVGAMLTFVLVASAMVLGYLNFRFGQITRIDVAIDVPPASGAPRNYLVVGTDSRAGLDEDDPANAVFFDDEGTVTADGPLRTDTIMILRVAPDTGEAALLSFPRDLFVDIAHDGGENRINVAFTQGREVLIDTIRENFDIPIHHYVEIDFVGFLELVEAVGGVPFYFEAPVRDEHSGLSVPQAGCVTLEPRQSLSFARSRYLEYQDVDTGRWRTDPSGDLGRITRQQAFIRRAIAKAVSKGLSNPATLNQLVDVAVDNVGLDPTLTVRDILGLGRRFAEFDAESLQTYSLPTTPFRTNAGAAVLALKDREAEPTLNIFRGLKPGQATPGTVEVTVLNGTDTSGFAADISAALGEIGFVEGETGNTEEAAERSAVYFAPGSEESAQLVARHLTSPVAFAATDELGPGEVVLVAGPDFTTVHRQPSPTVPELPTTTTTEPERGQGTTTITAPATTTTAPVGYLPEDEDAAAACT